MNEINLKQWHDEDFTFHKDTKISFAQCTPDCKMSWAEILKFTSDMAGEDFTQRGMSWDFLQDKGIVLVVTRIAFIVKKMPIGNQIISLRTWESAAQGPFCTRNYEISDRESGEILVIGQSLWTIVDLNTQKLMPAKSYPYRPAPTIVTEYEGHKLGKISIPENMELLGTHIVLYSELDANGHTNNSKYINFALDYMPEEFRSKELKEFRLNYSKEAHLGAVIEIKGCYNAEENKYIVQGTVEGNSSFECELYY